MSRFYNLYHGLDDYGYHHEFVVDIKVNGKRLSQGIKCGSSVTDVAHGLKALADWMISQDKDSLGTLDVLEAENQRLQYELALANQKLADIKAERD